MKAYNFEFAEYICEYLCIMSQIGMLLPIRIGSVIFKTQSNSCTNYFIEKENSNSVFLLLYASYRTECQRVAKSFSNSTSKTLMTDVRLKPHAVSRIFIPCVL